MVGDKVDKEASEPILKMPCELNCSRDVREEATEAVHGLGGCTRAGRLRRLAVHGD